MDTEKEIEVTNVDDTTPPAGDASAVVAESLSTVGYAMFALLNTGPLNQIPSMNDVVERFRAEDEAAALAAAGPVPVHEEPAYVGDPDGDDAFGEPSVGENFDAVPHPQMPVPAAAQVSASSVQVPVGPPAPEDVAAEDEAEETPEAHPQPKDPVGSVPAYTGNHTLQMLQEISFLDE